MFNYLFFLCCFFVDWVLQRCSHPVLHHTCTDLSSNWATTPSMQVSRCASFCIACGSVEEKANRLCKLVWKYRLLTWEFACREAGIRINLCRNPEVVTAGWDCPTRLCSHSWLKRVRHQKRSQNHRVTECWGLEGTSVGHLVQPPKFREEQVQCLRIPD